jgi:hypothetical protein
MNEDLKRRWQAYQRRRVDAIRAWFQDHDHEANTPMVRYIVLWSVFNALYNTADIPNNHLPNRRTGKYKFLKSRGHLIPKICVNSEYQRINSISDRLAERDDFLDCLEKYKEEILSLTDHRPRVDQPDNVDPNKIFPITYKEDGHWVEGEFSFDTIRGIASLDRRTYVSEDLLFYQFAPLDNPWEENGEISNKELFVEQILFALYQIRNNIVHGGSAAFMISDKPLVGSALPILKEIVDYLLGENGGDVIILQ